MTISNELSSEVATALLAAKDRSPQELTDLKHVVLQVHSMLRQMDLEAREKQTGAAKEDDSPCEE